jgi:chromosome segregation ATPase
MSDLGKHKSSVVDAESTDVTGLMNILCWCTDFDSLRPFAEQVRNARNTKWAHTPDLEISLEDKNSVIQSVEDLLTADALKSDPDAQKALQQIENIKNHFDAQKEERKVLLDFIDQTENELADLKKRLSQCEGERREDKKKIETLEHQLKQAIQRMQHIETKLQSVRRHSKGCLLAVILIACAVLLYTIVYDDSKF